MRVCFDLGTLCSRAGNKPVPGAAKMLHDLRSKGHTVILHTVVAVVAAPTLGERLGRWGFEFDEIYFGKPKADVYVDTRSLGVVSYDQVEDRVEELSSIPLIELVTSG